ATPISLHPEGAFAIGVEIGWRHVDVLLLNLHAQVLSRRRRDHAFPDAGSIIDDITAMMDDVLTSLPNGLRARLTTIGVALPTDIAGSQAIADAPEGQRALWAQLDIAAELSGRTGLAVSLFNDGNAACWGELIAFPKPRPADFIYFLIGRYIAAGIVGEGTLWEGPSDNSANLGSMLVDSGEAGLQVAHFIASVTALERRLEVAGF